MSAIVTALVRLILGCFVMAFLIVWLVGCAKPPEERNVWREWLDNP